MTQIEQIIQHARLVIDNHCEMTQEAIGCEFADIKARALRMSGYSKYKNEDWVDYIEGNVIPEELRATLIALDDVLASHYTS